ncbi:MAG: DinB family protein [Candidatus Acidiferrales bacterium]
MGTAVGFAKAAPSHSPVPPADAADKTAPSYDMKAQSIEDLKEMQKKFVSLATAIPAEKYAWRPGEGVRSVAELFLHVTAANHNIPTMMGEAKQAEFTAKGFETSTTDKAGIVSQLNDSFSYAISTVEKMSNADFAKPEKQLGPDANAGDVVYLLVTHAHEHLGQSIAYTRVNGVVPPWTAAAAKKQAQGATSTPD